MTRSAFPVGEGYVSPKPGLSKLSPKPGLSKLSPYLLVVAAAAGDPVVPLLEGLHLLVEAGFD